MKDAVRASAVILAVIAVSLAIVFLISRVPTSAYRHSTALWQAEFLTRDAADVYADYLRVGYAMPLDRRHTFAHVVGALLYDARGISGLSLCTGDFDYGCYHGFATRVIELNGTSGVAMLTAACVQNDPGTCEHGIGHGILAYLGDDHLADALALCRPMGGTDGGCYVGVFMEYFLKTARTAGDDHAWLPVDMNHPSGPCETVRDPEFLRACYFELPSLWRAWISKTYGAYGEQFRRVGILCAAIKNAEYRTRCFRGTGAQAAASTDFRSEEAAALCAVMPAQGRSACDAAVSDSLQSQGKTVHTDLR